MTAKYKIEVVNTNVYFYSNSWLWCKLTLFWFNRRATKVVMKYRNP